MTKSISQACGVTATNAAETSRVYVEFKPGQKNAAKALVQQAGGQIHHEFDSLNAVATKLPTPALAGIRNNPNITNAKKGTFEIIWTTDENATSEVVLNGITYSNTSLVKSHVMSFRGTKGASYTYTVRSADAAGNVAEAGEFTHQN